MSGPSKKAESSLDPYMGEGVYIHTIKQSYWSLYLLVSVDIMKPRQFALGKLLVHTQGIFFVPYYSAAVVFYL